MIVSPNRTLSVCMIVKNEAEVLGRCLSSIGSFADETVIVDTGSTDGTQEIARKHGATVIQSEWRNDFSYSRNISLEHASCDWVLWLDADDVVPESSAEGINTLKQQRPDKVLGFTIKNEKATKTGAEFVQARMFPNRPEIRFERRIHEQMMPSALRLGLTLINVPVVIEHHGYADGPVMEKKALRNVTLLLEEYEDIGPDPTAAVEIGDSYTIMLDNDKAATWYQAVLDMDGVEKSSPVVASQAYYGLGNLSNASKDYDAAVSHFDNACRLCPERTDAIYCKAVSQELAGRPEEAAETLFSILGIQSKPVLVGVNFRETQIKATLRLGRVLWDLGRREDLLAHARKSLERHPDRPEVHNMAGLAFLNAGDLMNALHIFEKSLQIAIEGNLDAYVGLCRIYTKAGREEQTLNTIEKIEGLFGHMPRYWALRKLKGMSCELPSHIPPEKVEEEQEFLKRTYGL